MQGAPSSQQDADGNTLQNSYTERDGYGPRGASQPFQAHSLNPSQQYPQGSQGGYESRGPTNKSHSRVSLSKHSNYESNMNAMQIEEINQQLLDREQVQQFRYQYEPQSVYARQAAHSGGMQRNDSMPLPLRNFEQNINYPQMDEETKRAQNDRVLKMLEDSLKTYDPLVPDNIVVNYQYQQQNEGTGQHTGDDDQTGLSKIEEINSFVEDDTRGQHTNGRIVEGGPEMASASEML